MKFCARCKVSKAFSEFRRQTDSIDGHASYCRDCATEKHREWCKKNPDVRKQHHRESWARHGAKKAPRKRERYLEVIAAEGREKFRTSSRIRYQKKKKQSPGYFTAKAALRRAAVKRATPPWVDRFAIAAIYAEAARQGKHVDHIIPLLGEGICGLHVPWNLQLLDPIENKIKGNRYSQPRPL